jgi:hypothetical protein
MLGMHMFLLGRRGFMSKEICFSKSYALGCSLSMQVAFKVALTVVLGAILAVMHIR